MNTLVIEPEEIKKIERRRQTMEILEFVKENDVDPVYFESSYYMMPESWQTPYALLTKHWKKVSMWLSPN